uniref:Uncharacterized protein n=1 Tax=Ditylenchus dipsaci TaxID=166011 RepID=A0A915DK25_9BILA
MMNKNSNVFAVFIPDSPDKKTFKEFKEVKEFLDSPDGRKEGTRFKRCADNEELDSFYADSLNDEKTPKKSAVIEPVTPYKSLPSYRFTDLRMAIEKKRNEDFDKLLKENPRFLVNTNNDLPTIVQEGYRYNALHISCRSSNFYVAKRILDFACDYNWLTDAYGTDAGVKERSEVFLDALLNTPDLIENNTPLHYACKFAQLDIVKLLTGFPTCKREQRNKYNEAPLDMLCRGSKEVLKKKRNYARKLHFVSLIFLLI